MRVLLSGWFSFPNMGTTAGDLLSRDVVVSWLESAGIPFEVAAIPRFGPGIEWRTADPSAYTDVLFVCGPAGNGPPLDEFLKRFRQCRLIGLNLSMLQPLEEWNPFDVLFERDSNRRVRPDLSLLSRNFSQSVAGLILIDHQPEYAERDAHVVANSALKQVLQESGIVAIPIDTCLEANLGGLTTPEQIEALVSRMDLIATTRLHGLILAIKNGVPAVVIDPVRGGGKIRRQAQALGWPAVLKVDFLNLAQLAELCSYCVKPEAKIKARECSRKGMQDIATLAQDLFNALK